VLKAKNLSANIQVQSVRLESVNEIEYKIPAVLNKNYSLIWPKSIKASVIRCY
jgi:hypothetical protein